MVALLAMLFTTGCGETADGPERAGVSGVVQLNGTPLQEGTIRFVPTDGTTGPKVSVRVIGGQFDADAEHGPVVGMNRVEIESTSGPAFDDEQQLASLQASPQRIHAVTVPAAYNTSSQLKAEIMAGAVNELSYHLTGPSSR